MTSRQVFDLLRRYESRNVTFLEADGSWPIVWQRARDAHVWDVNGRRYLDLTAAFGVAAAGHANPRVVRAGQRQMATLLHAMGDVHPHTLKAELARELSRITFERWGAPRKPSRTDESARTADGRFNTSTVHRAKTIFCNSGFEAVEAALKTALLATGKRGLIAFEGAYHGLGYGALNATHRQHFRSRFRSQLGGFGHFVPFPVAADRVVAEDRSLTSPGMQVEPGGAPGEVLVDGGARGGLALLDTHLRRLFQREKIGAILVEPVQVRGGINIPPPAFLPLLRRLCDEQHALLILDEIYTGFGRTGRWFACEQSGTVPDLICLGKALTGGFPLSACVGRADIMDAAWPPSAGEAIHTSTFLGHPVGCAMALAQIREITARGLVGQSRRLGKIFLDGLVSLPVPGSAIGVCRGLGLLAGLEVRDRDGSPATKPALQIIKAMLHRGYVVLPEGEHANVISFTPPLTITGRQLEIALDALGQVLSHT